MPRILPILLVLLSTPQALAAQWDEVQLTLTPRVGLYTQPRPFEQPFNDPPPEYRQVWRYRFESGPSFGLAADLAFPGKAIGLRVEANHTPSLTLRQDDGSLGPPVFEEGSSNDASVTTITAALRVEPRAACLGGVCPRLLLGAGLKRYRFDTELLSGDVVFPFAEDQSRLAVQLGAGISAPLGARTSLVAELNDYVNSVDLWQDEDGGWTHEAVLSVGIGVRVR